MNFTKQEFSCGRGGLTIRGTIRRPEADGPLPAAIASHGIMANRQSMDIYADFLAEEGCCTFTFDFCGGCVKGDSDGATTDMSVLTEAEDLCAVMDYVLSLPFTEKKDILLLGASQGGFVSAITAARRSAEVGSLILVYPAFCIPDDARRGQLIDAAYDPGAIPESFPCGHGAFLLGRRYPVDVMDMDAYAGITAYTGPVLILHGDADRLVNVNYSRKAYEIYRSAGNDAELLILKGAGHGFNEEESAQALAAMRAFVQQVR